MAVPADEARGILGRLGFEIDASDAADWRVRVPYWREVDVYREADLIEVVGRMAAGGLVRVRE